MYCLDTNIIIDCFHGDEETLKYINKIQNSEIKITSITLMELYAGCAVYEKRQKMYALIEEFMSTIDMVDFDKQTCKIYGDIYSFLRSKGKISEQQDMMIAAACIKNNLVLITKNKKHFQNIPGLKVEYC